MRLIGRVEEVEVKAAVRGQLGRDVARLGRGRAVGGGGAHRGQARGVDLGQRSADRAVLEQGPQPVDLFEVCPAQLGDDVAAARAVGDLPLARENLQRLSDRHEARPDPGRDLLLADPLPGGEIAGDDRLAQPRERVLLHRARAGGRRGRGACTPCGRGAHRNAWIPVSAWPTTSAWMSAVPS